MKRDEIESGKSFFIKIRDDYEGVETLSLFREHIVEVIFHKGYYFWRSYSSYEDYESVFTLNECIADLDGYIGLESDVKKHYKIARIEHSVIASYAIQSYLNEHDLNLIEASELFIESKYELYTDYVLMDQVE